MSKLSLFFYVLSLIITAIIFSFVHFLTEPIIIGSSKNSISNGNPGLFPLLFITPFFIVSIIGTFKIAYVAAKRTFKTVSFKIMMLFSFIFPSVMVLLTIKKAKEVRLIIFHHNDSVTDLAEIALLNTFSNHIFFNGWTLLALLLTIVWIAYLCVFMKPQDESLSWKNQVLDWFFLLCHPLLI